MIALNIASRNDLQMDKDLYVHLNVYVYAHFTGLVLFIE